MNETIKRSTQQERHCCLVYDSCAVDNASVEIFDPDYWAQSATRHNEGRGSVWFIDDAERQWVALVWAKVVQKRHFVNYCMY